MRAGSKNICFPWQNEVTLVSEPLHDPEDHEILVKSKCSLLSTGTETQCLAGEFDPGTNWESWVKYPFHPGYSVSGVVEAVGRSVSRFSVGDAVFVNHPHAQYCVVPESQEQTTRLAEGISIEEGAWLALAITTQLGVRRAELELGQRVGVVGLGLLGQLVVQYLRISGARDIIAIDFSAERLKLAKQGGATHTFQGAGRDALDTVRELTGGRMLDIVFDITGHPAVLAQAVQLVRKMGKVILLGDTSTPSKQVLGPGVVSDSKSILGIHASHYPREYTPFNPWTFEEMALLFFHYLTRSDMKLDFLKTRTVSPDAAPEIYPWVIENRESVMGVMFDWDLLA